MPSVYLLQLLEAGDDFYAFLLDTISVCSAIDI